MYFRLENKNPINHKIGNLIRVYNRSKRRGLKVSHLIFMSEDEKGNLMAGLIAETFGNSQIEYLFVKKN